MATLEDSGDNGVSRVLAARAALCVLFFVSGFPALIYQLAWQRALFTVYGVNVEAVTVVVTSFMLGLGFGSVFGGFLSRWRPFPPLVLFGVIELGIALAGVVSLGVIRQIGAVTLEWPSAATSAITLGLLFIPTVLMGATLPILVDYLARLSGNIGRSVGLLYFVNTLGSASACFAVAIWIMARFRMQGSVNLAAAINGTIGLLAIAVVASVKLIRSTALDRTGRSTNPGIPPRSAQAAGQPASGVDVDVPRRSSPYFIALALALLTGYLALSYEILWFRLFSQATGGKAAAFALMLGAYLGGLACGALAGRQFCGEPETTIHLRALAVFVFLGALLGVLVIPLVAGAAGAGIGYALPALALVFLHAALSGATFPLISHHGITLESEIGVQMSHVYLANILGAASGSLMTGFVLTDHLTTGGIALVLSLTGLALAASISWITNVTSRSRTFLVGGAATAGIIIALLQPSLYRNVYEKLQFNADYVQQGRFDAVVENKSGVIAVASDGTMYGGGVFDGGYVIDLAKNKNGIVRAFLLGYYHPAPKDVLMIGLSTGSWAQVIANNPLVERLDIVEINPAYLNLLAKYPVVASLARNPKVTIYVDDGRRWLTRHPHRKYDAVVQNTSFYWRAHTSNLLSLEYFDLLKANLKPDGIVQYNTTGSERAQKTGCLAFKHGERFSAYMTVSDELLRKSGDRLRDILTNYRIDGKPVLNANDHVHRQVIDGLITQLTHPETGGGHIEPCTPLSSRLSALQPITDDNMGHEWDQTAPQNDRIINAVRRYFGL
jgi:spermidine synthase